MKRRLVVTAAIAAIVVSGSGKLELGSNGLLPDGCTDVNPWGTAM